MKKIIVFFICFLVAFLFEGCSRRTQKEPQPTYAPRTSQSTDNIYPISKPFVSVDNDFTIISSTPVAYTTHKPCNEVDFYAAIVTRTSGYHGLVDISMSETEEDERYTCKYFGSAVVYKVKPNPITKEIPK